MFEKVILRNKFLVRCVFVTLGGLRPNNRNGPIEQVEGSLGHPPTALFDYSSGDIAEPVGRDQSSRDLIQFAYVI